MATLNTATAGGQVGVKSFAVTARESLESIVVAFALAFIFRAFIVEAFVIPTGSMAPTLYGQQVTHTCSTCGYEYAHGVDQVYAGGELTLKCPNCGSQRDKVSARELARPSSGDRILVHKWPFSVGGPLGPKRWGVTVFKDPHNGTVNYIKRMVGKPGEVLEIIHGDVYTAPLAEIRQKDPGLIEQMDQLRRDLYQYAHGNLTLQDHEVGARYREINQRLIPFLRIQRKAVTAPEAQESLWFTVYDRDFLPDYEHVRSQPDSRVGWAPLLMTIDSMGAEQLDSGLIPQDLQRQLEQRQIRLPENAVPVVGSPGEWRLNAEGGDLLIVREEDRLAVYDAAAKAAWDTSRTEVTFESPSERPLSIWLTGKPITDFYGYNYSQQNSSPGVPVGDLRLAFTWFPDAPTGGLQLEMNRHEDNFLARIQVDGTAEIQHWKPGLAKPNLIGQVKLDPFRPGQAIDIEFVNVDFRVSLTVDGREVIASTDEQYAPPIPALLARNGEDPAETIPSQVKIGGYNAKFRIDHLKLQRDEYYRSSPMVEPNSPPPQPGQPASAYQMARNPFHRWPGWGTQGCPIMLRDDEQAREYFMLGDNSPGSKDSRLWWEIGPHLLHLGENYQVGTVPEDQLIGEAFFVYWPSGYRRSWTADIGVIPNFGRMRWIR